jgi:preprotein translocase subunit YajC
LIDIAYAMAPGGQGGGGSNPMGTFLMLGMIFAIFYFLLIRPQQKKQKQHREMLTNLRKGDTIITAGGLIGRIISLSDAIVTVEVADKVRLKVLRSQISSVSNQPLLGEVDRKGSRKRAKEETELPEE